jgi:hypothetical protein
MKNVVIFSRLTAALLKRDENMNSKQEIRNKRTCCGYWGLIWIFGKNN